jgi:hypothetical protein
MDDSQMHYAKWKEPFWNHCTLHDSTSMTFLQGKTTGTASTPVTWVGKQTHNPGQRRMLGNFYLDCADGDMNVCIGQSSPTRYWEGSKILNRGNCFSVIFLPAWGYALDVTSNGTFHPHSLPGSFLGFIHFLKKNFFSFSFYSYVHTMFGSFLPLSPRPLLFPLPPPCPLYPLATRQKLFYPYL